MSGDVDTMRRFHRLVTERVGALHEEYLARPRPLAASRLLWEIGDGVEVRALRARLDLDSGYLARLLRRLESDGLIEVHVDERDGRVRTAQLTAAGREERELLDGRSDELVEALLAPLNLAQRETLVDAVATVERLLTAGLVKVAIVDPDSDDARFCVAQYFGELAERFEGGFDPSITRSASGDEVRPPAGLFLVASLRGESIGCGGLKFVGDGAAEIKRMWVAQSARGLGVGRRLLTDLEQAAHAGGATRVRLDTNRALREAIAMYRSSGYIEIPAFNDEPFAHHWFEKQVGD